MLKFLSVTLTIQTRSIETEFEIVYNHFSDELVVWYLDHPMLKRSIVIRAARPFQHGSAVINSLIDSLTLTPSEAKLLFARLLRAASTDSKL